MAFTATVPAAGCDVTVIEVRSAVPSVSVSFAGTSISTGVSSLVVGASATATGASLTLTVTVAVLDVFPMLSTTEYSKDAEPSKFASGVNVTVPSELATAVPSVFETIVMLSSSRSAPASGMSLIRTSTTTSVSSLVSTVSATASGALLRPKTVTDTVAILDTVPLSSAMVYWKVSTPRTPEPAVYVTVPPAMAERPPLSGALVMVTVAVSRPATAVSLAATSITVPPAFAVAWSSTATTGGTSSTSIVTTASFEGLPSVSRTM